MKLQWSIDKPDILGRPAGLGPSIPERKTREAAKLGKPGGLARLIPEGIRRRIVEAFGGGSLLGQTAGGDEDLIGYRPLQQRIDSLTRDLDAWTYDKQIRMALYLYATNPLARWLIENLLDVVLGERFGFTVEVNAEALNITPEKAKEIQQSIYKHLETFWEHPAHSLDSRAREYAATQLVTGALLLPQSQAETAEGQSVDGVPLLDLIDAQQIAKVESADRSAIVPGTVWYRGASATADAKPLEVIRQRERGGPLEGEAFYFPLRSLLNQLMGTSYLLDVIDWLDRHDQFMFAGLDRAKLANNYAMHVTMEGLSSQQCIEHAAVLKKQGFLNEPAGLVVTNEKGKLEAVSPDLRSGDIETLARTYRTHILGSKSRPESWYSAGGETNRATAGEQTDVAYKALGRWQDHFRNIFETMLHFAYDSGKRAQPEHRRQWPDRSTKAIAIKVNLPPIQERDYGRLGQALNAIETGLQAAVDDEMLSQQTARLIFQTAAAKLGAEIDPNREQERIDQEREQSEQKDIERSSAAAKAAKNLADQLGDEKDDDAPEQAAAPAKAKEPEPAEAPKEAPAAA